MAVTIVPAKSPQNTAQEPPPKNKGGRKPGQKDTKPRKKRTDRAAGYVPTPEPIPIQHVKGKLEETRNLSNAQLVERARALPRDAMDMPRDADPEEYNAERMVLCYRLIIRGLSLAQIATQMDLTEETVRRYLKKIRSDLKLDPKTLNVGYYMGESLAFYQEIRQMALLTASSNKESTATKLNAMRVAMQAETDKNLFLTRIGVYSPVVIERIEHWLSGAADEMVNPTQHEQKRVNIAAEVGRALAKRGQQADYSGVTDVVTNMPREMVDQVQSIAPQGEGAQGG